MTTRVVGERGVGKSMLETRQSSFQEVTSEWYFWEELKNTWGFVLYIFYDGNWLLWSRALPLSLPIDWDSIYNSSLIPCLRRKHYHATVVQGESSFVKDGLCHGTNPSRHSQQNVSLEFHNMIAFHQIAVWLRDGLWNFPPSHHSQRHCKDQQNQVWLLSVIPIFTERLRSTHTTSLLCPSPQSYTFQRPNYVRKVWHSSSL